MSFFPPITISSAIQKIDYQQLLLPAIQREFVWNSQDIELLFDSLMRGYPIGSLLLWKVEGKNKEDHRYYSILKKYREKYNTHCDEVITDSLPDFEAILDGQQRLTALYIGLKGTYAYKLPRLKWRDNEYALPTRKLYLNLSRLESQDETEGEVPEDSRVFDFKFLTKDELEEKSKEDWFEVNKILALQGTSKLMKYIKERGDAENEFVNETLSALHDVVHVTPLINYYLEVDQDYDKALNIFVRINNGGTKLDYSDLIMSTTIAGWSEKDARQEFNSLIDEVWDSLGFEIGKDLILRSYLMLFSDDIKFRVSNFSIENAKEFEGNWDAIRSAIVMSFQLISDFGYSERTITSKNAVLPVVYYLYKIGRVKDFNKKVGYAEDRKGIRRWLHAVLLHRTFGGQADNVLKTIRDVVKDEISVGATTFPAVKIANKLARTRKSINVDDEFIEGLLYTQYEDRYAFPILAVLYPHLDYKNGDFHKDHLHPKSYFSKSKLEKKVIDINADNEWYYLNKECFNSICNLQMLDGNENKAKGDSSLKEWVTSCGVDKDKLFIPDVFGFDEFPQFIDIRIGLLKSKLKEELTFS